MTWFERLNKMTGRIALTRESENECLVKYTAIPGDHVEIGCLWGGTAIITALAKQDAGVTGYVYTIDPMTGGWWDTEDPAVHLRPTPKIVKANLRAFGVNKRVRVVQSVSNPWPISKDVKPTSILIDGDHRFENVFVDWRNASSISTRYILMHDYNSKDHPGVQRVVDEVARKNKQWKIVELVNSLLVFERA
jgi:cephalosporin hydroxylase